MLLRAWNDGADPEIFDLYPYATTNPVFFRSGEAAATHCGADADYFIAWIDRVTKVRGRSIQGYNTAAERDSTLAQIADALERLAATPLIRRRGPPRELALRSASRRARAPPRSRRCRASSR